MHFGHRGACRPVQMLKNYSGDAEKMEGTRRVKTVFWVLFYRDGSISDSRKFKDHFWIISGFRQLSLGDLECVSSIARGWWFSRSERFFLSQSRAAHAKYLMLSNFRSNNTLFVLFAVECIFMRKQWALVYDECFLSRFMTMESTGVFRYVKSSQAVSLSENISIASLVITYRL